MDLPTRIGRYEVIRELGQGGMGRVLLARDSVLGRLVALKLLRADLGLPPDLHKGLVDRMRQEARAAAALSHPNMVTLHDMGEDEGLGLYLVFEHIDGPTLRERLQAGPLLPSEVARIARELGDALTCAHDAGVIHRDVKPENVMLSKTGAKLTDFGIARVPDSTLTRAGSVLGTPAYNAPEALALGEFGPLSDQFSLATTLYEALGGRRAFTGEDTLVVATKVARELPPPLESFAPDPRSVARADVVLERAMAKDRAKRFPSCTAFGEAMARALDPTATQPLPMIPTPPASRATLVSPQTRKLQNVIAALAVLVIAALVLLGRQSQDPAGGVSLRKVAGDFSATLAIPAPPGHPHGTGGPAVAPSAPPLPSAPRAPIPSASASASAPKPEAAPSSESSASRTGDAGLNVGEAGTAAHP